VKVRSDEGKAYALSRGGKRRRKKKQEGGTRESEPSIVGKM